MPGFRKTTKLVNSRGETVKGFDPHCFCKTLDKCCNIKLREEEAGQAVTHWQEGFISKEKMVMLHQMLGVPMPTCAKCHLQIQHCECIYEKLDSAVVREPKKPEPIIEILNDESDDVWNEPEFARTILDATYFFPGLFESELIEEESATKRVQELLAEEEKKRAEEEKSRQLRAYEEAKARKAAFIEKAKKDAERFAKAAEEVRIRREAENARKLAHRAEADRKRKELLESAKKRVRETLLGHDPDDPNVYPDSERRTASVNHLVETMERRNALAKNLLDKKNKTDYNASDLLKALEEELFALQRKAQDEINRTGKVALSTEACINHLSERVQALRYPASAIRLEKSGNSTTVTIPTSAVQDRAVTEKQLNHFFPNSELRGWQWKVLKDTIANTLAVRYDDISITKSTAGELLNRGDVIRIVVKEQFGKNWKFYTFDINEKIYHEIAKWNTNVNVKLIREGFQQFMIDRMTWNRREQLATENETEKRRDFLAMSKLHSTGFTNTKGPR